MEVIYKVANFLVRRLKLKSWRFQCQGRSVVSCSALPRENNRTGGSALCQWGSSGSGKFDAQNKAFTFDDHTNFKLDANILPIAR